MGRLILDFSMSKGLPYNYVTQTLFRSFITVSEKLTKLSGDHSPSPNWVTLRSLTWTKLYQSLTQDQPHPN